MPVSGFLDPDLSPEGPTHGNPSDIDSATAAPMAHNPVPRRDTSTTVAFPVRSRWSSAAAIPPAIVIAPIESPYAGAGCAMNASRSGGCTPLATLDRHQYPR